MEEHPGLLIPFLASALASLALTPVAIAVARMGGICDVPDEAGLKIHHGAVPVLGGCSVLLSIGAALLPPVVLHPPPRVGVVLSCAALLVALGVVDDLRNLPALLRLAAHFLVALALALFGVRLDAFPGDVADLALTVLIVMGLINALNLLDGMDGLASGVGACCALGFLGLALAQGNPYGVVAAVLLGALLGFLPYNFHPARIFLGDNGSTLLGFLLAVLVISSSGGRRPVTPLLASLAVVWVPVFDTGCAIWRRVRGGRSLFVGDRDHFYDRLARRGLTQRQVAAVGYGLSLAGCAAGWGLYLLYASR